MTPSRKRWIAVAIVLLVASLIAVGVMRALSARQAQQLALVKASSAKEVELVELAATDVVKAQSLELTQGIAVSGSIRAVHSAVIKARVAGELEGLSVREGDFVKAGQVIARIDSTEYQSRVRQAREQAEASRAQVEVVQRQYDNNKALVDQGFISRTALDTSLANLNAARATYQAAQAATELASKTLGDTVLRAPIAGQVSQRLAQPGERVGVDARIVELVDLSQLELEAALGASDAALVRIGQTATLQIEGSAEVAAATVARINPSTQGGSRSVLAYLSIANTGTGKALPLRQGLFAQGTLGAVRTTQLAVPLSSVRTDRPTPYLQAVESGRIAYRPVELGARGTGPAPDSGETMVAIKGTGVDEHTVAVRGHIGSLREGVAVRFTPASGTTTRGPADAAAGPKAP